jgi:hypothetical protein
VIVSPSGQDEIMTPPGSQTCSTGAAMLTPIRIPVLRPVAPPPTARQRRSARPSHRRRRRPGWR